MNPSYPEIRDEIRSSIMQKIDFSREVPDSEVLDLIDRQLTNGGEDPVILMPLEEKKRLRQELFHSIRRMDVLQDLLEDPEVTEIMVNGPGNIFMEKAGSLTRYPGKFSSPEKLEDVIQQIVGASNRVVNTSSPIVDCRLANGDRVNVVLDPIAVNGPILTIRRFPQDPITMEDLLRFGSITEEVAAFLGKCVRAGLNIFISGGTGCCGFRIHMPCSLHMGIVGNQSAGLIEQQAVLFRIVICGKGLRRRIALIGDLIIAVCPGKGLVGRGECARINPDRGKIGHGDIRLCDALFGDRCIGFSAGRFFGLYAGLLGELCGGIGLIGGCASGQQERSGEKRDRSVLHRYASFLRKSPLLCLV